MSRGSLWEVRYAPLRALLFVRGIYLLLALDLWLTMVEHGGRYGVGDFNVAHFAWLDLLVPLPTPTLYVGLLIACGFLSSQLAIVGGPRIFKLLLCALYTLAWAISLHDSYQHHYLLSWLLLWCAACPTPSLSDLSVLPNQPVQGWGLPMASITCAIVYTFTGISKCEPEWRSGQVLRALTNSRAPGARDPGTVDGLRDLVIGLGVDESTFWCALALSTIALQWSIAVAYLAAPRRDERPTRARLTLVSLGLVSAMTFHALAEILHMFEIGLFSYYMLWIALVMFAPVEPLEPAVARLAARLRDLRAPASKLAALLALLLLVAVGYFVPLPGATAAATAIALVNAARMAHQSSSGRSLRDLTLATSVSALAGWCMLSLTSVPFDYYRRTAGELRRMGRLEAALELYHQAERYAPAGKSRMRIIRQLEAELVRTSHDPTPRAP